MLFTKIAPMYVRPLSLIQVDMDVNAERVMILNRDTGGLVYLGLAPTNNVLKRLFPIKYSVTSDLLVGILDDDKVYNCKFLDGVTAELVDANSIDLTK